MNLGFPQTGYKEGAFDGRASVFQAGFDRGYANGFANGFHLGRYQGLSTAFGQIDNRRASDDESSSGQLDLLLVKPTRGQCRVCVDQLLINQSIPQIEEIQREHAARVKNALSERYRDVEQFVAAGTDEVR